MQSIEVEELSNVRGGIAGLLQAAGPILNGVANIIGAAKSGGSQQAPAPQGGSASFAAAASFTSAAPPPSDPSVSVSVRTGSF